MTIIEGLHVFLNVVGNYGCVRVFELLTHLGARAYIVVLLKALYARNLLLLRIPSCPIAAAVYRVSVEFLFGLSRDF